MSSPAVPATHHWCSHCATMLRPPRLWASAYALQASKMLNEEITSLIGGLRSSSNSSLAAFARMEQKVEALEAEAEAAGQLGVRALRLWQLFLLTPLLADKVAAAAS